MNAYTPEENCLVEKLNGSLRNKFRAIRQATGLLTTLWGKILHYVVEVDNMSFTKALGEVTPFEMITGRKPDARNLRVCGRVAFAYVPKGKRPHKLSPKAVPTLFFRTCVQVAWISTAGRTKWQADRETRWLLP